jgi:hypothetical protein
MRTSFNDLRSLANPPQLVKEILDCVSILYGNTYHEWRHIKIMIAQKSFFSELAAISKETLVERRELIKGKTFNPASF